MIVIGVIGGSACDDSEAEIAERVGELIAERGAALVCGGLAGVMEAAAKGARQKGGLTIGVLPGVEASDANEYITLPIVTGMGHARNIVIVQTASALVAIAGGAGTLSEIAIAIKTGKKVVSIGKRYGVAGVIEASTPEEAIDLIFDELDQY